MTTTTATTTAPLFQLARDSFDLYLQHAEKWQQAVRAQLDEGTRLSTQLQEQMMTATRNLLDTVEKVTEETVQATTERMKAFQAGSKA